ncbi:type II secretion system protein GspL [Phenylobacterium sp.]|jgi:general secretion pathway protein L|uniref:type II secretion system protein GspL n=1 Tax=Phenylobacterium sp. TaxID=1871053 RepID=UPI002E2FA4D6|nr:type II secretion system protein GspL [Phenylobacterium sp.]HEX2558749.1 type II secretion system protein GspL [Phenylobacterium sp.]
MTAWRLIFIPSDHQAAPAVRVIDAEGRIFERGTLQIGPNPAPAGARTVLVAPGMDVAVHWLQLPTRNDVQARAAAALLLEERLARPAGEAHLALGPRDAEDHRLAAAVEKSRMQSWASLAGLHGVRPDLVVPDHLLLPEPDGEEVFAADMGGWLAVRGRRLAFSCEPDMLEVLLPDRSVRRTDDEAALAKLWAKALAAPAVNLLQGDFDPARAEQVAPRDLRRAAVLAAVALIAPALVLGVQAWRYDRAADAAERAAAAQVATVLPNGQAVTDPLAQAQARLAGLELAAGGGPISASAQLFAAVETIQEAQVETLIVSPEGEVRAGISHTNYSDVELLREAMRKAGLAFREESSREEGGRLMSDVIVGSRP